MFVWQLTPVDSTDANWEASSYRGMVVVRAKDEDAAREQAETEFGLKTRFPPGRGIAAPPWKRPALVKAEIINDPRYDSDGPSEILYPTM